jgi:D-alanine-D-alanine ligase
MISIVFGGVSYEHEISIVSAITLKKVLAKSMVQYIFLDANRDFYLIDAKEMKSNTFSSGAYRKAKKLYLMSGGFVTMGLMGQKKIDVGTVLNLIHGADGEDGTMAALFDFHKIAYIGPRKEASQVSFNKWFTKQFAQALAVKTVDYEVLNRDDAYKTHFDFPVIIKPLRLGSSIGVSVVKEADELEYALDTAFEYDNQVMIEPFIAGVKEYNLAGCSGSSDIAYSIIEEPAKAEFLDFEKKYLDFNREGKSEDAGLCAELSTKMHDTFAKLYNPLFEGSLIRCDFFVIDDEVYLNEINPIPGSMANYLFEDFPRVIETLSTKLPRAHKISVNYNYINKIQSAKGKA